MHSQLFYCSLWVGVVLAPLEWLALKDSTLDYYKKQMQSRCKLIYNSLSSCYLLTLKVVSMCWESCLRSSRPCRITSIAGAPDVKDIIADNNDRCRYVLFCWFNYHAWWQDHHAWWQVKPGSQYDTGTASVIYMSVIGKVFFFTSQIISLTLNFSTVWLVGMQANTGDTMLE